MTVGVTAARRVRRRWAAYGILLGVTVVLMLLSTNPLAIETQKGIAFALSLGTAIGRLVKVHPRAAFLISTGTAICGGSAIAAIGPVVKATED